MIFEFCGFEADDEVYELRDSRGAVIALQPRMFDVLLHLLRNRTRVVLKEELIERVWGGVCVTPNAVTQAVVGVRRVIEPEGSDLLISTVRGRGYRFVGLATERTTPVKHRPELDALVEVLRAASRTTSLDVLLESLRIADPDTHALVDEAAAAIRRSAVSRSGFPPALAPRVAAGATSRLYR